MLVPEWCSRRKCALAGQCLCLASSCLICDCLKLSSLAAIAEEARQKADGAISMSSSEGLKGGSTLLSASSSQEAHDGHFV